MERRQGKTRWLPICQSDDALADNNKSWWLEFSLLKRRLSRKSRQIHPRLVPQQPQQRQQQQQHLWRQHPPIIINSNFILKEIWPPIALVVFDSFLWVSWIHTSATLNDAMHYEFFCFKKWPFTNHYYCFKNSFFCWNQKCSQCNENLCWTKQLIF